MSDFLGLSDIFQTLGIGPETAGNIAPVLGDALIGAGLGAGGAALTGGRPGQGALIGAGIGGVAGLADQFLGGFINGVSGSGGGGVPGGATISIPGTSGTPSAGALPGAGAAAAPGSVPLSPTNSGIIGDLSGGNFQSLLASAGGGGGTDPNVLGGAGIGGGGGAPGAAGGPSAGDLANAASGTAVGLGGAAGGGAPSSLMELLRNPSLDTGGTFLKNNSNLIIPALGLGYTALQGNKSLPGEKQIEGTAAQLGAQGQQLQNYLQTGTLPPGVHQSITSAGEAAKAHIKSMYAARGMSGSSAEQQDIANVDQQMTTQASNIAMSLLQQGVQESQISAQLYQTILANTLGQDQELAKAIGAFAAASAGGGGQTIRLTAG